MMVTKNITVTTKRVAPTIIDIIRGASMTNSWPPCSKPFVTLAKTFDSIDGIILCSSISDIVIEVVTIAAVDASTVGLLLLLVADIDATVLVLNDTILVYVLGEEVEAVLVLVLVIE